MLKERRKGDSRGAYIGSLSRLRDSFVHCRYRESSDCHLTIHITFKSGGLIRKKLLHDPKTLLTCLFFSFFFLLFTSLTHNKLAHAILRRSVSFFFYVPNDSTTAWIKFFF